jgi:TP901 family phage tail tape measure protein
MGLNIGDVLMRVIADMTGFEADVTKGAARAGDKAGQSLGSRMSKGATVGLTAVGAAAGTVFVGAIGGAANFEDQLRTINTVAHLTDDELKGVGNSILDLSKETGKSTDDLTAGFYDLVSAGVPADKAIKVLKDSAVLATGALGTTGEAVDLLTSAINAYGLEASDSTKITDIFAQAVADGKVTAAELGSSIANIAPIAASAGISLEEVGAGYAVLTAKGVPAAQAATQMRAAISALLTPNEQLNKLQAQTGINFAEMAKQKGLVATLEEIRKATNGDNDAFAKALGSIEGYQFAVQTTGENAADFATELDKVTKASEEGGVAQGQYEERMKSAAMQGKKFAAGLRATALQIAGPFVDSLGGAVIALNEVGGGMGGLVNLSRLFGGTLGGIAGFLGSKLGPKLKDGFARALGKVVIPDKAVAHIADDIGEGIAANIGRSGRMGPLFEKAGSLMGGRFGIAFKLAALLGIIAIADELLPKAEQLGKDFHDALFPNDGGPLGDIGDALEGFGKWTQDLPWPLGPKDQPDWATIGTRTKEGVKTAVTDPVTEGLHAATDDIPGKVADDLAGGRSAVAGGARKMMAGVGDAAKSADGTSLGSKVAAGVAQGMYDTAIAKQSVVQDAFQLLLSADKNTMHKVDEINYLVGVLTSKELAHGLTDTRASVRAAAEETRRAAEARLAELRPNAGNIGKKTNQELAAGMKSKDPQVRAQAQRTASVITSTIRGAKTRPAGQTAGQNIANGLNDKSGAIGRAAAHLASVVYSTFIHSVQFSAAHHSNPKPAERRAGGGPVEKGQVYRVGEEGEELFVPKTAGVIIPHDQIASYAAPPTPITDGKTEINLKTYGLPLRAETPAEVAAQLRRISGMGLVSPKRRLSWSG